MNDVDPLAYFTDALT
ncbi:hypothetical protein QA636_35285 [Bradyrhizobium brasilense]|uniref:Uncharacterized protein n=1 Tax=Bradyrhizobium brasilense TaxID=1419277 RepID=A0ABY8JRC7_9BRAD|nr:hypothetical protein QA636_35285 [Bradyrhizobium brasilense]